MNTQPFKVLFACGGTAGHINPAVALANLFSARYKNCQILFVGAKGGMEETLVPKEGYRIETVSISNFRRSIHPADIAHNFGTVYNLYRSRKQCRDILDRFSPNLVVGTGGYASFPIVYAAAKRAIPTAVHESNAVPGLTTKALSKVANRVFVGFEESKRYYSCPEKVVVTGTPVRDGFFTYTRQQAREKLGITGQKPLLLSYWGSLGAQAMNEMMVDFIAQECYDGAPFHHIHGAGRDFAHMNEQLLRRNLNLKDAGIEVKEYIYDMPLVMAAADLVLCRAGASTISELSALAKPSILVPSPNVTANHQEKNAQVLQAHGAAVVMLEHECTAQALFHTADQLLRDQKRTDAMVLALKTMDTADSTDKIFAALQQLVEER